MDTAMTHQHCGQVSKSSGCRTTDHRTDQSATGYQPFNLPDPPTDPVQLTTGLTCRLPGTSCSIRQPRPQMLITNSSSLLHRHQSQVNMAAAASPLMLPGTSLMSSGGRRWCLLPRFRCRSPSVTSPSLIQRRHRAHMRIDWRWRLPISRWRHCDMETTASARQGGGV